MTIFLIIIDMSIPFLCGPMPSKKPHIFFSLSQYFLQMSSVSLSANVVERQGHQWSPTPVIVLFYNLLPWCWKDL